MRVTSAVELGRFLRERRRQLGLTQVHLAARAGVSRRWLSDLEAGKERAELGLVIQTLHALSTVMDLQPEESTGEINLDEFLDQHRTRVRQPIGGPGRANPIAGPDLGDPNDPMTDRR